MNRALKLISMALIMALLSVSFFGCYGNFAATRKLYSFNGSFNNKYVNSVLMYVMLTALPVYEIAAAADILVFNTVEFWTGSNPMAMGPNDEVIKYAQENDKDLKVTIRQNQVIVEDMNNPGQELQLSYKPFEKSWYYQGENGLVKIATLSGENIALHQPNGKTMYVNPAL